MGNVLSRQEGQMVVELVVVMPMVIAVALIIFNLMAFMEAASRFDRVSFDAVLALGVSSGAGDTGGGARSVSDAIERSMSGLWGVEVAVRREGVWDAASDEGLGFVLAPHLSRYVCEMKYRPWPGGFSIGGFEVGFPFELGHRRSIVVDRYRSGVLF